MIAKELRDARWKLVVGSLLFVAFITGGLFPYEEITRDWQDAQRTVGPQSPDELAMLMMWLAYSNGQIFLALLAVVLGVGLISGETSRGTIFFLLSKPIGRAHILLVKYAVGALALFVTALLGSIGIIVSASANEFPVGSLNVVGVSLSTMLAWLGSLSVFGVALLASVISSDLLRSISITLLVVGLMFYFPLMYVGAEQYLDDKFVFPGPSEQYFPDFWYSESLYLGESFAGMHFLVCLIAAALPLLAALLLFHRKAY